MKKKRKKSRFLRIIFLLIIICTVGMTAFHFLNPWGMSAKNLLGVGLPKMSLESPKNVPNEYFVDIKDNRIFYQGHNQCGAFSSAFVLRNLGIDVYGQDLYGQMSPKMKNGYLLPNAIVDLFNKNGFKASFKKGDLQNLKYEVSKGKPVIVVIGKGFNWQHYVVVTGYDANNIYTVDSLVSETNANYNRFYTNENFLKLWQNDLPIFNGLYISIE